MKNFYYHNPTKLVFGDDSVEKLAELMSQKNGNVLLHYGQGSIKKTGLYDKVVGILNEKNIEFVELGGVEPNPKLRLVRKGIDICRNEEIDFILAVGGGSVIDSAKAIAAGVMYDGDVWDLFTGKGSFDKALPIGVILTIPATGSETSPNTVITNEEELLKMGMGKDCLRPEFAILNPNLTMTLPENQTFAGIVDIISHILERYFTNTKNVDLTDNLCEGTLKTIIDSSYKLKENPNDYSARAEIMLSGTIAHGGILGLGREEDWGSHRIGHEITALYGTTHGVTLSIIFPAWMKYVCKENTERFARFAIEVFGVSEEGKSQEQIALEGVDEFEKFLMDIGMPIRLSEANIPTDKFELMAEKCTKDGHVGGLKKLYKDDVIEILKLAK